MNSFSRSLLGTLLATAGLLTGQSTPDMALIPVTSQFSEPSKGIDLEGRNLRFVPSNSGYRLTAQEWAWEEAANGDETITLNSPINGISVPLQGWRFPFSGQQWESLFLNSSGSVTFTAPEDLVALPRYFYYRDIGAERAGTGPILAALWRRFPPGMKVRIAHRNSRIILTQEFEESPTDANRFLDRQSRFVAQIVLEQSGAIEFRYRQCSFVDGSVILAPQVRPAAEPRRLDQRTFAPQQPALDPYLDFQSVLVEQVNPLQIRFTIRVRGPIPAPRRDLLYWIFLDTQETAADTPFSWTPWNCSIGVSRRSDTEWVARYCRGETPVEVEGDQVRIVLPRSALGVAERIRYAVVTQDNARPNVFKAAGNFLLSLGGSHLYAGPRDLSRDSGEFTAPLWESFHHRWIDPDTAKITQNFYRQYGDDYDFLVLFTAFPYDNTEVGGSFSGGANSIRGTNIPVSDSGARRFGSSGRLQGVINPIMLGAPFHAETGVDYAGAWQDHARSMWLLNHEAGHRWGMLLEFMDGDVRRRLWEPGNHWTDGLFAPSAFPLQSPGDETSPMGGYRWEAKPDGATFEAWYQGHLVPSGFSWLDLYAMGLAEPSEVPDLKMVSDLEWIGWDSTTGRRLARGRERTIRMADVVAAMGPRTHAGERPQTNFRAAFLLVTEENGRVAPELLARIDRIRRLWEDSFSRATGGRATMSTQLLSSR